MIAGSWQPDAFWLGACLKYNAPMANPHPLAGVVPQVVHPVNDGETTVTEPIEKIEGEVALDTYVKAQTSRRRSSRGSRNWRTACGAWLTPFCIPAA